MSELIEYRIVMEAKEREGRDEYIVCKEVPQCAHTSEFQDLSVCAKLEDVHPDFQRNLFVTVRQRRQNELPSL